MRRLMTVAMATTMLGMGVRSAAAQDPAAAGAHWPMVPAKMGPVTGWPR